MRSALPACPLPGLSGRGVHPSVPRGLGWPSPRRSAAPLCASLAPQPADPALHPARAEHLRLPALLERPVLRPGDQLGEEAAGIQSGCVPAGRAGLPAPSPRGLWCRSGSSLTPRVFLRSSLHLPRVHDVAADGDPAAGGAGLPLALLGDPLCHVQVGGGVLGSPRAPRSALRAGQERGGWFGCPVPPPRAPLVRGAGGAAVGRWGLGSGALAELGGIFLRGAGAPGAVQLCSSSPPPPQGVSASVAASGSCGPRCSGPSSPRPPWGCLPSAW